MSSIDDPGSWCAAYIALARLFFHVNGTLPINHSSGWNVQGYLALSLFLSIFFRRCTILTPLNQSYMHRMHQVNVIFPMWEAYPGAKKSPFVASAWFMMFKFLPKWWTCYASLHVSQSMKYSKCKMVTLYCTYKMSCWADLLFLLQDLKICIRMY